MAGGIVFSGGRMARRSDELYGNGQHYFSVHDIQPSPPPPPPPPPTVNNTDTDDTSPTIAVQYTRVTSFYAFRRKQVTTDTCIRLSVMPGVPTANLVIPLCHVEYLL